MRDGPEAIIEKLYTLEKNVAGKHMRTALREGAKIVQAQMIADAPVKTGATRDAIKVRATKRSRKGFGITVSLREGWFRGKTFYAGFVEFGHRVGKRPSGGKIKAGLDARGRIHGLHWMKAAWDHSIGLASQAVFAKLKELAEQEGEK